MNWFYMITYIILQFYKVTHFLLNFIIIYSIIHYYFI